MAQPCHPESLTEVRPSETSSSEQEHVESSYYRCAKCGEHWKHVVTDLIGIERPDDRHFEQWQKGGDHRSLAV